MNKGRLEAFTDAVLAIAMTILVLELAQPKAPTFAAVWELRQSYATYLISFVGLAVMWNNHHHIFQLVRVIDGRVLWANCMMLFFATLFPYATKFVDTHFFDFVPELFYWVVFCMLSVGYFLVYATLAKADPGNEKLRTAVVRPAKIIADFSVKGVGLIVGFFYPPAMIIGTFAAMFIWVIPERKAEKALKIR
ncbi:MAG: TMEM175 family protein [Bifidobacteriaceae bacterium]|jgi:uncharacterized membrane protein|nr:TMEM175 family protein [Bifidobacteriaceae bacterium]